MMLILERSVQKRRERIATITEASQPARPKRSSETPRVPIQQAQPSPTLAPRPPQYPPSNPVPAGSVSTSTEYEVAPGPLAPSKPVKTVVTARQEEPPANTAADPPPPQDVVKLVCVSCGVKHLRRSLKSGIYCPSCPEHSNEMGCARCGTIRTEERRACRKCHGKFK